MATTALSWQQKSIGMGVLSLMVSSLMAANVTQIHRYATVDNKPLAAQVNPLLSVQRVHFPQTIKTVGEALKYWTGFSGFALVDESLQSMALKTMLKQPLPVVVRTLGPLTVQEGAEVLVGKAVFSLKSDALLRTLNFDLKPQYAARFSKGSHA